MKKLSIYEEAVRDLTSLRIPCITHVILGLPGETTEDMLETVEYLNGTERRPFASMEKLTQEGRYVSYGYYDGNGLLAYACYILTADRLFALLDWKYRKGFAYTE